MKKLPLIWQDSVFTNDFSKINSRLNRSKLFAKSQPNLLDLDEGVSEPEQQRLGANQMRGAVSISDLLADESQQAEVREDLPPMTSSSTVKGARRKSALIAQWENRIHQQDFWSVEPIKYLKFNKG